MTYIKNIMKQAGYLFIIFFLTANPAAADDTCIFQVSADDVPPNIVLLLDNGSEVENIAWHEKYVNSTDHTPAAGATNITWNDRSTTTGFTNDQGYSMVSHGGKYYLVRIQNDLKPAAYDTGLLRESQTSGTVDKATFTINGRSIELPASPSTVVESDTVTLPEDPPRNVTFNVKDNATIFRYSKNYLNWLFYGSYNVDGAGDGSDLPDKSRFYYAKKAIFTVAEMTQRQAYFSIYAFTANADGASNVQPFGFVYDVSGVVDANFVNNVNNLGTVYYSPLAEGLASIGGYYGSPSSGVVGEYCQKNFIIAITSGLSSEDQATAAGSVPASLSDYDNDNPSVTEGKIPLSNGTTITVSKNINGSSYMDDIAYYLSTHDIVDYQPGYQNVYTYTIGFMGNDETNAYLINTSNNGNENLNLYDVTDGEYGKYHFAAENPEALSEQLINALNSILSTTSTFTAPVVPVTRTTSGNRIYLAFFKPIDGSNFWEGNVTKFGLSGDSTILNSDGTTEATWPNGAIRENAVPYWATIDWADTSKSNGILNSSRNIYTYMGSSTNLTDSSNAFAAGNTILISDADSNDISDKLDTYMDASGPVELTNVTGSFSAGDVITGERSGASASIASISGAADIKVIYSGKNSLNFMTGEVVTNGTGAAGTIVTTGTSEIINYIRGADVLDEDGDGNIVENRELICGDPLHSEPIVVNYGDTDSDPSTDEQIMVYFGGNDGMLHAVNDEDGTEAWAFVPPDLLPNLKNILEASSHQYYVDSTPAVMIKDYNGDGTIDPLGSPADKVYLVCGERKGGTGYFALDVTDPATPKFLWRIAQTSGTPAATTVIPELGESWSIPNFAVVKTSAADPGTDVVIIGGGYSDDNTKGRTVLIINAETGAVIKQFSVTDHADMTFSIPSEIYLLDRNYNGFIDKMYVGDMGGQLWRIGKFDSTAFPDSDEDVTNWELYKLFTARCNESICDDTVDNNGNSLIDEADPSKFFYPPTVTLENDSDIVFIGSGDREDACGTDHYNALYAIKDVHSDLSVFPLTLGDLADADTTSATYIEPDILGADAGWYLVMDTGEKALSESVVFNKTLYATTFLPNNEACVPGGYAKVYELNYLTGAPKFDLDNDSSIDADDLSKVIGGGIPSKPVVVITGDNVAKLLISTSSTNPDPTSPETTAGVLSVDLEFPAVNFFLQWWRDLF
ncbi:PilC/PilY family type IV pilus protein [Desulfobacter sp.]|uniref:pilus assembly protein n=1 Tax=Desulfobacter sp. TaxID=2294 RepID=UPI00257FFADF|nr:PilC/PilY family type IV pilus protein [Desulfobacter sp.]